MKDINLKIINVRLGFANNSSSSHSMIIWSNGKLPKESWDKGDYGWEDFTLTSKEAKTDYLATAIYQQLLKSSTDEYGAWLIVKELFNFSDEKEAPVGIEGGIDHQSTFCLPTEKDNVTLNTEFIKDFHKWLLSEKVIVLGGNDNSDGHPLSNGEELIFQRESANNFIARKDDLSGSWTLFNKENGAKIRFIFGSLLA